MGSIRVLRLRTPSSKGLERVVSEAPQGLPTARVLASPGRMLRGRGAPSAKKDFPGRKGSEVCCAKEKLTLSPQGLARPWWPPNPGLLCEEGNRDGSPRLDPLCLPLGVPAFRAASSLGNEASAGPEWTPACSTGVGLAAMTSRWAKSDPTQLCGARMPASPKASSLTGT